MLAIFHFLQRLFSFLLLATLLGAPTPSFAILNGQFLRSPEFRWIVSISTGDEGFCTGSLLNAEWVLTSHHCVRDLHEMSVHVVDYPAGFDFERFQDVQALVDTYGAHKAPLISEFIVESALVAEAIVPQEFSDLKDVALLRLQQPVTEVPYFPQVIRPEEAVELRSRGNHDLQVVVAGNGLNGLQGTPYEEGVGFFFRAYYYTDLIPELSAQTTLFSLINPGVERGFYRTDLGYRPPLYEDDPGHPSYEARSAMIAGGDSGGPLLALIDDTWKILGVTKGARGSFLYQYRTRRGIFHLGSAASHMQVDTILCELLLQADGRLSLPGYESCS